MMRTFGRDIAAGFTLVELVIAMAITAVLGLVICGVAVGVSNAYSNSEDYYQSLQTNRALMMRMQSLIHEARLVTAASETAVVLWVGDTDGSNNGVGNGEINRDELRMIAYDSIKKQVSQVFVEFPAYADKTALNVIRPLSTVSSVSTASNLLASDVYSQTQILANDVTEFKVSVSPSTPKSELLFLQVTIGAGKRSLTLRSTSRLRASDTANVGQVSGQWVLSP